MTFAGFRTMGPRCGCVPVPPPLPGRCCAGAVRMDPHQVFLTLRAVAGASPNCPDVVDFPLNAGQGFFGFGEAGAQFGGSLIFWSLNWIGITCSPDNNFVFAIFQNPSAGGFPGAFINADNQPDGGGGILSCSPLHIRGRFTLPGQAFLHPSYLCGQANPGFPGFGAPTTFEIEITE
jgi:hypothetical protein